MQYEITEAIPLLDERGELTRAGYAKRLLPVYDRKKVKGGLTRLKEWDYYYVGNDCFGVALTIADNSYMGLDSISFLSFVDRPWQITKSPMSAFPMGRTGLPATSEVGMAASSGKKHALLFQTSEGKRQLTAHMDDFRDGQPIDVHLTLTGEPEESMVLCTPFAKRGHFYFNQKINCMRAQGTVRIGDDLYSFRPSDSFAVLDWGGGCGPITTPGIGAPPPGCWTGRTSASTSGTALGTPPPPRKICSFTRERPTSSPR